MEEYRQRFTCVPPSSGQEQFEATGIPPEESHRMGERRAGEPHKPWHCACLQPLLLRSPTGYTKADPS